MIRVKCIEKYSIHSSNFTCHILRAQSAYLLELQHNVTVIEELSCGKHNSKEEVREREVVVEM